MPGMARRLLLGQRMSAAGLVVVELACDADVAARRGTAGDVGCRGSWPMCRRSGSRSPDRCRGLVDESGGGGWAPRSVAWPSPAWSRCVASVGAVATAAAAAAPGAALHLPLAGLLGEVAATRSAWRCGASHGAGVVRRRLRGALRARGGAFMPVMGLGVPRMARGPVLVRHGRSGPSAFLTATRGAHRNRGERVTGCWPVGNASKRWR